MNRNIKFLLFFPLVAVILASAVSCGSHDKIVLKVLNAGSLMEPFLHFEKEFEIQHPNIDVQPEGHGSVQVIRYMTDLGKEADVAAVADEQLIPMLMYRSQMPNGKGPYADWYIRFANNRLCLAYTSASKYSSEINAANWYDILARKDVRIGLADPSIDSLGYRAFMLIYLAGRYYGDDTLFQRLIADNFNSGPDLSESGGVTIINIPQLMKPSQERVSLRSYSIQLLALLDSGDIDYAFEYESVIRQRGLNFLDLPREIDMSSPEEAGIYDTVRVKLNFQRFASVIPDFVGAPIVYGVTIPRNAPHKEAAVTFLEFMLGQDGQRIFADDFQPTLSPPTADGMENLPDRLKPYVK